MHPDVIRVFITESVAELEARLATSDVAVAGINLDLTVPELTIVFDHEEHETAIATLPMSLLGPAGEQILQEHRVPILGQPPRSRRLCLRMNLERFDLVPPTAELLDEAREPLQWDQWPTSWLGRGIVRQHPAYGRPFFCRPGLREYHEHQQHEDAPWARWRDTLPLHAIVIGLLTDLRDRFHGAA